jgi:hypothetical protein
MKPQTPIKRHLSVDNFQTMVKRSGAASKLQTLLTMGGSDQLAIVAHDKVGIKRTAEAVICFPSQGHLATQAGTLGKEVNVCALAPPALTVG